MDLKGLLQVDDALRGISDASHGHHQSIARDFEMENENAVSDTSEVGSIRSPLARRNSARRDTAGRRGRPREFRQQHDKSRDTSSSRSTSPAN